MRPLSQAPRSTFPPQRQQRSSPITRPFFGIGAREERRLTYLHTRAHRIRWPDPLSPNRIYLAELLDVDDVDPAAHDLVEAGVGGLEAGLDVTHCLMLVGYQQDVKMRWAIGLIFRRWVMERQTYSLSSDAAFDDIACLRVVPHPACYMQGCG